MLAIHLRMMKSQGYLVKFIAFEVISCFISTTLFRAKDLFFLFFILTKRIYFLGPSLHQLVKIIIYL